MIEVKICGITNREDALAACREGAHALGFIFYPRSPRFVSPDRAAEIIRGLPEGICRVGVFADEEPGEVARIARLCGLDLIQLHGRESPDYCSLFPPRSLLKAVSLRGEEDLESLPRYPVKAILVDTYDPALPGGTGRTGDWALARRAATRHRVVLAGGLKAENIRSALEAVKPSAIDVGSGVEAGPGKKDPRKLKEFLSLIKREGGRLPRPSLGNPVFERATSSRAGGQR